MSRSNYELLAYADSIPYTQKSISKLDAAETDIAEKLESAKSSLSEPDGLRDRCEMSQITI